MPMMEHMEHVAHPFLHHLQRVNAKIEIFFPVNAIDILM